MTIKWICGNCLHWVAWIINPAWVLCYLAVLYWLFNVTWCLCVHCRPLSLLSKLGKEWNACRTMSELEQLRQEAEQLRNQIRVRTDALSSSKDFATHSVKSFGSFNIDYFNACWKDCIYELIAQDHHHKFMINRGKLKIFLKSSV